MTSSEYPLYTIWNKPAVLNRNKPVTLLLLIYLEGGSAQGIKESESQELRRVGSHEVMNKQMQICVLIRVVLGHTLTKSAFKVLWSYTDSSLSARFFR